MCKNNGKRKNRVRWGRVIILLAIVILMIVIGINSHKKLKKEKTEAPKPIASTLSSTETQNNSTLQYYVDAEDAEDAEATEKPDISEDYHKSYYSQSEKNSMIEFEASEYCKQFQAYYSIRLERFVSGFEMYHLMRITYSESGNQGLTGKTAVAATILNRMEDSSGLFEDSIYDVIFQKFQFSSADIIDDQRETPGKYFSGGIEQEYQKLDDKLIADCLTAVKRALDGEDPTKEITGGALFFFNPEQCSEEELALRANIPYDKIFIEEEHWFYREWQ